MRLFVALDLSDEIRHAIGDVIAKLRPHSRGARWVRREGMHVTLKFIGETDPSRLDPILGALSAVHSLQTFDLKVRGVGFFPDGRRPRVVWCGVESSSSLSNLAAAVDHPLEPLGIAREKRAYAPHLTLARFKSPEHVDNLVRMAQSLEECEFGSVRETEFHLFQSILKPSGAEYKKLATFPFSGERT